MSTTDQIHAALTKGEVAGETACLAADNEVHELMGKLKALYERIYGAIAADIHDWHWIATKVKQSPESPDAPASTADDHPADPPASAAPATEVADAPREPPAEPPTVPVIETTKPD